RLQIASKREDGKEDPSFFERITYFDVFPQLMLPATTSTGFFAAFNVSPSLRRILREGSRTIMTYVRPGSALYLEPGRAGKKDIVGTLIQLINGRVVPVEDADVRLARDPESQVRSQRGSFR